MGNDNDAFQDRFLANEQRHDATLRCLNLFHLIRALNMSKFLFNILLLVFVVAAPANAQTFLVYGSGEPADRMVVYAGLLVRDRTPMDALFGPERIMQIEIDLIFEAPDKPEWVEMTLQFACEPEASTVPVGKNKKRPDKSVIRDVPDRFQIVSGSEYTRTRTYNEIAPEGWAPVTSEMMAQVRKVACNHIGIYNAIKAATRNGQPDQAQFRSSLSHFGLQDILYVGDDTSGFALSDLTWTNLWADGKRPELKGTGRQLTEAEIAENEKKYAAIEAQMADIASQASAYAQPQIDELDTQAAFAEQAGKVRGNRKVSKIESSAIQVWQGKREYDVALAMGPAGVSDMDGLRFLTYTTEFQRPAQTIVVGPEGETAQAGGEYARCDVRFILAYDRKGIPRVADVTMKLYQDDPAWGNHTCDDAIKTPVN
ncbi:MAG: hypothetical protein ABL928_09750 [Sphingorhabdus sp.]